MTRVNISWERRPQAPTADRLRRLVRTALGRLEVPPAEVNILITGDPRVRALNQSYRGIDRPTDVLSFTDGDELPDGHRLLGDIVISLDTARRQAAAAGLDEVRELEELVLHGVLHLLGWDHTADDGEMERLELRLREELLS